jgi:hypothetical protein
MEGYIPGTYLLYISMLKDLTVVRYNWSRGSSGSILSDYGLDDRGSIPGRGNGFFS